MNKTPVFDHRKLIVDRRLSLEDADTIASGHARIVVHPDAGRSCAAAHERLQTAIAARAHIYGITTGFGPLANRLVNAEDAQTLQQNLVHHLASGVGPAFDWGTARAIVLARLMSLLQGVSGASAEAIDALVTLLNSDLAPVIPSKGTVGASGDLTPLAHLVLCFQGRGAFVAHDGTRHDRTQGLRKLGLAPLDLARRDGLALANGTSAMTGIAVRNTASLRRLICWSERLTAALAEVLGARAEAWHIAFAEARPHPGQVKATEALNQALSGSERINRALLATEVLSDEKTDLREGPGQDAYTLRCAPQVLGAVWDTADWHAGVVAREFTAATDNPIFPTDAAAPALHGGNFMGQHVALAADALSNAVCVLAGLVERQIARLTDERLNAGLPAFLHEGPAGLNSGLMGAQVTATALLAEMRSVGPASVHSISTNAANQDVVSMGTIAARHCQEKIHALSQILAILGIAVAQAMDLRGTKPAFSNSAREMHGLVRQYSARLRTDRPLGAEITALAQALETTPPQTLAPNR